MGIKRTEGSHPFKENLTVNAEPIGTMIRRIRNLRLGSSGYIIPRPDSGDFGRRMAPFGPLDSAYQSPQSLASYVSGSLRLDRTLDW